MTRLFLNTGIFNLESQTPGSMWNGGFVCLYTCLLFFWGRSVVARLIQSLVAFSLCNRFHMGKTWQPRNALSPWRKWSPALFLSSGCELLSYFSKILVENGLINSDFLLILHLFSSGCSVVHFPFYFSRSLIKYQCSVSWSELDLEGQQSCAGLFCITSIRSALDTLIQQPQQSHLSPKDGKYWYVSSKM